MKQKFKEILTLLVKLNKNFPSQKNRFAPIQKENRRIKRLDSLDQKVISSLTLLKQHPALSMNETMEQICYLNIYLDSYIYHIESIHEIIEKLVPANKKDLNHD